MVSAFHAPFLIKTALESLDLEARSPTPSNLEREDTPVEFTHDQDETKDDMSETEDEEVKMNCIGGVQAYMTSDEDDFDSDDDSCCSDDSREDG